MTPPRWPLVIGTLIVALTVTQEPPERPAPPPGWFCSWFAPPTDPHHCTCRRACTGRGEERTVNHDPVCTVYCHEAHCGCPIRSCPGT